MHKTIRVVRINQDEENFENAHGVSRWQVYTIQRTIYNPKSHPHLSKSSHYHHNKTHHSQCHMKHSPVVQFEILSYHFLDQA